MRKSGKRLSVNELRNRMQDTFINSLPVAQLVDRLRAKYPLYSRAKLQPFIRLVKQTLDSDRTNNIKSNNNKRNRKPRDTRVFEYSDDDDDDDVMPARKKTKKVDGRERKLESNRRRMESVSDSGSGFGSGEVDGEEVNISAASMSVDDDHSEPEFDLMKSMLRNKYGASKMVKNDVKNVELEVVTFNNKNVDLMIEGKGKGKEWKSNEGLGDDGNGDVNDGLRFKDLGGMEEVLEALKTEVIVPFLNPMVPRRIGVRPITGILLHGPPGCGKTTLAHVIANEAGVPFYKVSATELVSGISGASEENIRKLFSKAYRTAPSIVFIDEIDAIASKRENLHREMERRIVTQLVVCMDASYMYAKPNDTSKNTATSDGKLGYVLVIGATNRPNTLDPALRRPGRFDREIFLGVPDENARVHILSVLTKNMKIESDFDLPKLARATPGYVGADLSALMNTAGNLSMKRIIEERVLELNKKGTEEKEDLWRKAWTAEEMEKLGITMSDVEAATKLVQPSSRREGFSSIPDVKWEDVGGLDLLRKEFERYIVKRIKSPYENEESGTDLESGFLLYGPPGCGKTLIAKAVANEAGANFIHIKGPELLNKYVGESELAVRTIFSRARTCSPCILFFDEVDALTKKRGMEGGWVVERLIDQLLIELDGADQRKGVYIIGATNRPEVIDPALLRPGRFGKLIYVPLPNQDERALILKALCKKKPLDDDVDLVGIARSEACAGFSGADLKALVNEANMASIEEKYSKIEAAKAAAAAREGTSVSSSLSPSDWSSMPRTINVAHFGQAFRIISCSVSDKQKQYYHLVQGSFKQS